MLTRPSYLGKEIDLCKSNPARSGNPYPRSIFLLALVASFIVLSGMVLFWFKPFSSASFYEWPIFFHIKRIFVFEGIAGPIFLIAASMILLFEFFFPAAKSQKLISLGLLQDFVWLLYDIVLSALFIVTYLQFLKWIYIHFFGFMQIETIGRLPGPVRMIWAILLGDFIFWVNHWLRHKVPWFWYFHAIHHSQKEMNMFTSLRYHFGEYLISRTISIFPMLIFTVNTPTIVSYLLGITWYTRLYHANIKLNFGPLRYIFVTPQSHRIHHSSEKQHIDKNFGSLFSIWDYLFGTQLRDYEAYPKVGIKDSEFPHETTLKGLSLFFIPFKQMIYPFRLIGRDILKHKSVSFFLEFVGRQMNIRHDKDRPNHNAGG